LVKVAGQQAGAGALDEGEGLDSVAAEGKVLEAPVLTAFWNNCGC
jgi:hypothetical protein